MNGSNSNTSGDAVAKIEYKPKGASDLISDAKMEEIVRRMVVTWESGTTGFQFSPTEPEDHSRPWWPTDPQTGIPVGSQPKVWDSNAGEWVPIDEIAQYVPPKERHGTLYFEPGESTQNMEFVDIGTTNYMVLWAPTTLYQGAFLPFAGDFPKQFGFAVVSKSTNQVGIAVDGIPNLGSEETPKGMTFEITVRERK